MANTYLGADSARNNPSLQSPNLRIAIGQAMKRHGIEATRFGREAVGDPRFVLDLLKGREARPKTEARVREYITTLDTLGKTLTHRERALTFARAATMIRSIRTASGAMEIAAIMAETASERATFSEGLNRAIDAARVYRLSGEANHA